MYTLARSAPLRAFYFASAPDCPGIIMRLLHQRAGRRVPPSFVLVIWNLAPGFSSAIVAGIFVPDGIDGCVTVPGAPLSRFQFPRGGVVRNEIVGFKLRFRARFKPVHVYSFRERVAYAYRIR